MACAGGANPYDTASMHTLDKLRHTIPALRISTEQSDLAHYGRDWTRRWTPAPLAIVFPADTAEVQALVQWARATGTPLVPSGGRTGLSGGAVAANGEVVVSLERMNRILAFDPVDRTLTVQAGATLQSVQDAAGKQGLSYPVDFASRGSCTIGGTIATNAGGIRVIRHGNTREWIAGLTLVAGTGEVMRLNRGLIKNSSGYDLRHLVIGSEGTLGIVTEAIIRLGAPLPASKVVLLALPSFDAVMAAFVEVRGALGLQAFEFFTGDALRHVVAHGAQDPFAEMHPAYALVEVDSIDDAEDTEMLAVLERCLERGVASDIVVAGSDAQVAALWRLRESITESIAARTPYKNDIAVRVSALPAFLAEAEALLAAGYPTFEVIWFGHIGDGNLHISILRPEDLAPDAFVAHCEHATDMLADVLARHDGSISAEHGIGLVKKPWLARMRGEAEMVRLRGIRETFDPDGILNPGKVFD